MVRRLANKGRRYIPKTTKPGKRQYNSRQEKLLEYQKKIQDAEYVNRAIEKVAVEMTHFLYKVR